MPDRPSLRAARNGIAWILKQQRADGSFGNPEDGIGAYYKIPYALTLAGRVREAQRLAGWIAKHNVASNGDFRAPARKALQPFHELWPAYGSSWLVLGLHRLGRWDLSLPAADLLQGQQNGAGGFPAGSGPEAFLEPVCTSWGGLALLATGRLEGARRAGDLLARLVSDQPEPSRFYFRMTLQGQIDTLVPEGSDLFHYVDAGRSRQIYYNPGIALIFLSHLYRATGNPSYLQAALSLFEFTQKCASDVYSFPPSGKLGLGCALLYSICRENGPARAAREVAAYLVRSQQNGGFWALPDEELYASVADKDGLEVRLDLTAEYTIFLIEIDSLLV